MVLLHFGRPPADEIDWICGDWSIFIESSHPQQHHLIIIIIQNSRGCGVFPRIAKMGKPVAINKILFMPSYARERAMMMWTSDNHHKMVTPNSQNLNYIVSRLSLCLVAHLNACLLVYRHLIENHIQTWKVILSTGWWSSQWKLVMLNAPQQMMAVH